MEPPPGVSPNDSKNHVVIGVTTFVLTVAFTALSLRIYTRAVLIKAIGMDDYAAVCAFLLVFACGFCVALNTKYGLGTHVYFLSEEQIGFYMKTFYASVVFYNAALMGIKVTFLLQYWRLLAVQRYRKIFIVAMVLVFGWSTSQVLVEIFICTPIQRFWNPNLPGSCIPNYPQWYINAGGNIVTDVIVFVLPLPVVSNLNLAKGQKYVLLGIFCLGFFTVSISIIRIRFLKLTEDFTWVNVEAAGWSIGELCSGLTCSCLLTFRPLVAHWFPRLSAHLSKKTSNNARHADSYEPGSLRSPGLESDWPRRKIHSSESKKDLYSEMQHELSRTGEHVSKRGSDGGTSCQLEELGEPSDPEGSPRLGRVFGLVHMGSDATLEGLRPDHGGEVTTHIAAGYSKDERRQSRPRPIEVRCDIVQEVVPAWGRHRVVDEEKLQFHSHHEGRK